MKYCVRLFIHIGAKEKLLKEQTYSTPPFVPHKGDIVYNDFDVYVVRSVCMSYDDPEAQTVKIMLEPDNCDKEFWWK